MRIVPSRRSRARALGAASLALAACLGSGLSAAASHAAPAGLGMRPDVATDAPAFVPAAARGLTDQTPQARSAGAAAPAGSAAAAGDAATKVLPAAADALRQLPTGAECPAGMTRARTLYAGGFEDRVLPEATYTKGWSIVSGGRTGSYAAKSSISATDPSTQPSADTGYWPLAIPYVTSGGGRTILRYAIKGDYPDDAAYVAVNAESGWAAPSSSWGLVTLDVTDAITAADANSLDVRFANFPAQPATNSTMYLDDIEVYACSAASKTRGDFDGDGLADLLTVNAGGDLQLWPATGDLHLKSPIRAGWGWGGATWLGSPGDLNGDGRADIMARFSDGRLMAYYGDGAGGFTVGSKQVGKGWNGMTGIVPMGDLDGDGNFDVLARDAVGNIRRYWFVSDGTMTGGTIVGVGFGGFTSLFTMGDFDRDGRWDLTGIAPNGDMRVYTTLPTGGLWGTGQKIGNGWAFKQVSSSGDYDRNGYADVLGLTYDGRILGYPAKAGGTWGATVTTGVGFGTFRLIL